MKLELHRQSFEKSSNIKFHKKKNLSAESRVVPCGRTDEQTDKTKLIVAFRNFANVPKIRGQLVEVRKYHLSQIQKCRLLELAPFTLYSASASALRWM